VRGNFTEIERYVHWLGTVRGRQFADYAQLWRWSIEDLAGFWASVWEYFDISGGYQTVLESPDMPGAHWFPGARLNYAEHALGGAEDAERVALVAYSQSRESTTLTFGELADQVGRTRAGLLRLGVGAGDRVVGYLPNIPETIVAFLACASLGAVWAGCAPEFGARSVIDRFAQLRPTVLLTVGGYHYGAKAVDKTADVAALRAGLPSVRTVVGIPYGEFTVADSLPWADLLAEPGPVDCVPLPFDHPLWVLFSSGTTGLPKAIVHGHGGILLEHLKIHALHLDSRPGDRILWFTTTAWMMWNVLVSGLLRRATLILVDGNPMYPDVAAQWRMAARARATLLGTSPGYLMACRKAGVEPTAEQDLSALRTLGVTGSPLPEEGFDWAKERLGARVLINSMSGGTDVCSAFVAGNPWLAARRDEIAGPCLGVDVTAFDPAGHEVIGRVGELVIRRPMPSMPVRFWDDPDNERYRSSYFDTYPGVWCHGDWVTVSRHRGFAISGRSDATLNRGGVRLGTAEFYAVVEELPEISDSLVVHLEDAEGGPGRLLLFVAVADDAVLDETLRARVRAALREQLSPRHVPDVIAEVPAIPRTLTGKKLETPIKKILQGRPVAEVIDAAAVTDGDAIPAFTDIRDTVVMP
jgi:acetoacetyl-CoA synthetase